MTITSRMLILLLLSFSLFSRESRAQTTPPAQPSTSTQKTKQKAEKKTVNILIETSMGDIEAELDEAKAPISVANFLGYIDEGYYKDLIFHRVIQGFMIQGGGFDKNLSQRPSKAPIKNEAHNGLANSKGTLAMARTPDPHSASSQFYINLNDNNFLNYKNPAEYGYAVFGRVTKGMDVVEAIGAVATGYNGPMADVPNTPVIIKNISRK